MATMGVAGDWKNEKHRCSSSWIRRCFSSAENITDNAEESSSCSAKNNQPNGGGCEEEEHVTVGEEISRWNTLAPYFVLLLVLFAAGLTFVASWSCNTFYGAAIPWFVGGGYGIWSLQDSGHNCQLWSVLFFSYELDAPLRAARFFSMTSMLTSLLAIAILTQLVPWGRMGSWIVAIALFYWLGDSLSYWWRFNVWSTFFILTYLWVVLWVRCIGLERYAPRTLWRVVKKLLGVAGVGSAGIFFILASRVCLCDDLTAEDLEYYYGYGDDDHGHSHDDNDDDDPFSAYADLLDTTALYTSDCSGECVLGPTSNTAVATPFLWIAAWLLAHYGVPSSHFSSQSGNQRISAATATASAATAAAKCDKNKRPAAAAASILPSNENETVADASPTNRRPRLGTATTFGASIDEDDDDDDDEVHVDRNQQEQQQQQQQQHDDDRHSQFQSAESGVDSRQDNVRADGCTLDPIPETAMTSTTNTIPNYTTNEQVLLVEPTEGHLEEVQCQRHDANDVSSSDDTNITSNPNDYSPQEQEQRKRKPTRWRKMEHVFFGIINVLYLLVVVVMVGAYYENKNAAKAPDTSYNFITDVVCAFHPLDSNRPFETFDNTTQAQLAGYEVAHCGECGKCSNPTDIERYVETRTTVAKSAKGCSIQAIFGRDEELMDCLEKEIGFTRSCTGCWADNMRMTAKHCMWTCLSSMLIGIASSNTVKDAQDYDWLNQCVFCDEKRSGPDFVQCSGVARRRLGIPSEFERNPLEQCRHVTIDYLETPSDWSQVFPPP